MREKLVGYSLDLTNLVGGPKAQGLGDSKLIEISDDRGVMLLIEVAEDRLRLIAKHS